MFPRVRAFFAWLFSAPDQVPEAPLTFPTPASSRPVNRSPRVYCPVCGRDVAITANGITFEHRTRPGTNDQTRHRVRIIDAEVVA